MERADELWRCIKFNKDATPKQLRKWCRELIKLEAEMEATMNKLDGEYYRYCYNCKDFEPTRECEDGWMCLTCGKKIDYYDRLKELPEVKDE